jgi:Ca2+-transporting ATPase
MLPILLAVSLAVAVIPEGLPAMSTVLMSMGVRKMAKENAIVKKLPAVETLGSCTCICSDKTGTLTLNQMTVTKIFTPDEIISNKVDEPIEVKSENNEIYKELLKCGALCNTATLNQDNSTVGDPTEGALLLVCQQFKLSYETLRIEHPKLFELPFDSDRKRMSTIQKVFDNDVLFCKGATEEVLDICDYYQDANGQKQPMTEQIKNQIKDLNANLSAQALRILSFAKRELNDEVKDQNLENHLTYIGLMGMIDPPRKEVKAAVLKCRDAGIKVVMITGDHAITAKAIASELTIFQEGNEVMNGDELEKISEEELMKKVQKITVFSRISPSGKLKIINALKRSNEIVSMTGDGVNDAPSLKAADIGVAMGITGTDVAKASADVILLDDNFTTIGNAVFEGRRIFRNIQKVVQFLVSGCIAEVLVIIFATILSTFFGSSWDEILNPIQILMLNLVTDTIPCFAIGADKLTKNSKFKKPDVFREIFSKNVMFNIAITGAYFSLIALVGYVLGEVLLHETPHAGMTIAFLTLSLVQVFHTFNMQSNFVSIFSKENQFNKLVPILTGSSILVIAAFVVVGLVGGPVASQTLGIVSLPA